MSESQEDGTDGDVLAPMETYTRKGSDPLISTARGKLQSKRSKVNDEINRELRMRSGAENLFRATDNKRLKELVAVELLFFNSNIQLLKEELSELNSSITIYQHDCSVSHPPMIPLGLKETKDVDFKMVIKDFIMEHYSEDAEKYTTEIQDLHELRQAMRTPQRNETGVELLMEYYNQLYFLEKRFFPPERSVALHFHWYDSLTGVPNTQKTLVFEKGCVLFNIGALYTQLACKQDRNSLDGLRRAIRNFELAGGAFRYLHNHFSHAPSMDMQPRTLTMLVQLMMAQAQECVYEMILIDGVADGILQYFLAAQEAAMVSQMYRDAHALMSNEPVKEYIPFSWLSMTQVKAEYYSALAHHRIAEALLEQPDSLDQEKVTEVMAGLHWQEDGEEERPVDVPKSFEDRKQLAKAHLREALICHEEALRLHDLCKQLRKIDTFLGILKRAHERSISSFSTLEEEDDFSEIFSAPKIEPRTQQIVIPSRPEFSKIKVQEIFQKLGPITIFNAKTEWSVPRTVKLDRTSEQGFGFSVRGDSPVKVADIEPGSVAEFSNMRVGDMVVAVGDTDVRWAKHDEVVNHVRKAGNHLELCVVTPLNKDGFEPQTLPSAPSTPGTPMRMQGSLSGMSSKSNKSRLSAPWIFVRKGSREKEKSDLPVRSKEEEEELDLFHM